MEKSLSLASGANGHLECVVCMEVRDGTIYHCDNDHLLCSECYDNIKAAAAGNVQAALSCPTCRARYPTDPPRKARVVQEVIAAIIAKCPNSSSGCEVEDERRR